MTPYQIKSAKSSLALEILIVEETGYLSYKKLFKVANEVRPMFKYDISVQEKKRVDKLTYVVANLNKLRKIVGDLEELESLHKEYGTTLEHYRIVGECLLWTFEKGMGDKWNKEFECAWLAGIQFYQMRWWK